MRSHPFVVLFLLSILGACQTHEDTKAIAVYEANYKEYRNANYYHIGYNDYYQFLDFDLNSFTDTVLKCNAQLFKDSVLLKKLNKQMKNWLRKEIFIERTQTAFGSLVVDTTNMLLMNSDEDLKYYMQTEVKKGQNMDGRLFSQPRSVNVFEMDGKKIYIDLVPANVRFIKEIGEYRFVTKGNLRPLPNSGSDRVDIRHFCDLIEADWFITYSSDDFFEKGLAIKISGLSYHYKNDPVRKEKRER